ncbi:16S rRNA (guanine(966)-N(2))-methyltransferase RsmD [Candidatus Synchoanobacter obligatus]|uniref:Ribosomal RNA small subunit methyltransferase D n=1 Tax=Candidatus Synchoanobacter obligatus TaxID=2919597 RepID=A0ABT1L464_9GAMM|nr:16S rRNA (guanine(966)-N(2))-methyltransferase RsmD [Candidatus Synchoanobacter obligatus]MCP8351736.1 16S rRNA (guanine(966)-N(2))-methyltransferase RsmD [Candidatus Synchoanobacter obligatus]
MGSVRIQSGQYRNRQVAFLDDVGIRPTGSRVRKILFDWLRMNLDGKKCLDLFSGSGILAFEAVSEGAKSILCIEQNQLSCQYINKAASKLGDVNIRVMCHSIPCDIDETFDVCFMDPPFGDEALRQQSIQWLINRQVLAVGGLLYIESGTMLEDIEGFSQIKCKRVGQVWMHLYKREL